MEKERSIKTVRILVVDDHASLRTMLGMVLTENADYQIVGEANSGLEALQLCSALEPDLVILDLVLPGLNGLEVLRRLRAAGSKARVLVYSGSSNRELIIETLQCRPDGFVGKCDSLETLRKAVDAVARGGSSFPTLSKEMLRHVSITCGKPLLTDREREVLQLVAEGYTNKAMADRLSVSVKTVENHRAHLMEKLNLHDAASLTRYAVRHGLISLE